MAADIQRQIAAAMRQVRRVASRAVAKVTLDVEANLIETTPVDTGWARANWVPSVGTPFRGPAGSREQAEAGSVNTGAQAAGEARVAAYDVRQGPAFVSNSVPYIEDLNDGTSQQAPAGFVQAAVEKATTQDFRSFRG